MIIDSSSLIIFAKINKLNVLERLYKSLGITKEVYKETVEEGLVVGASDAEIIKKYVESGKIKIIPLNEKYEKISEELIKIYPQIDIGESSIISLCLQESKRGVIIDEATARKVAKLYGVRAVGSLRILLESYKKDIINENEIREIVSEIIKNKFRLGGEVINEFWNIFEKIKKRN
jgi:predicted nucleic acid-binding protein